MGVYALKVSYDMIRTELTTVLPFADVNLSISFVVCSFVPLLSQTNGEIRSFPSHFINSFAQFLTSDEGQAMTA